jgi:hypothetical protein
VLDQGGELRQQIAIDLDPHWQPRHSSITHARRFRRLLEWPSHDHTVRTPGTRFRATTSGAMPASRSTAFASRVTVTVGHGSHSPAST